MSIKTCRLGKGLRVKSISSISLFVCLFFFFFFKYLEGLKDRKMDEPIDKWTAIHEGKLQLSLYHTMPTFTDPKEEGFGKHCGKKEKMLVTRIFSFPHCVFYSVKQRNFHYSNLYFVFYKCFQFGHIQVFTTIPSFNEGGPKSGKRASEKMENKGKC